MSAMGCDVCDEASMHPRNDEHIMTPVGQLEPLRTAYNSKKPSKLKGNNQLFKVYANINPHIFPTSFSQPHNTLQIKFVQVGCDPAKYKKWR
jgi:hypothetical protein